MLHQFCETITLDRRLPRLVETHAALADERTVPGHKEVIAHNDALDDINERIVVADAAVRGQKLHEGESTAAQHLIANSARGNAFERAVIAANGLTKNKGAGSMTLGVLQNGRLIATKPDILTAHHVADVKDVLNVTFTEQLEARQVWPKCPAFPLA